MRRAALILASLTLVGCATSVEADGTSTATVAPGRTAAATTAEDNFLADIFNTPGLTSTMAESDMIGIGRSICDAIGTPGLTREKFEAALGTSKLGPEVAAVFIDAAERHLCPLKSYVPYPEGSILDSVAPTVEPAGPASALSDGTYEVGVDVEPGKYKTSGGADCYWEWLDANDGSVGDIIDNNIGAGPQTVTINDGEYFGSQRCGTWTLQP